MMEESKKMAIMVLCGKERKVMGCAVENLFLTPRGKHLLKLYRVKVMEQAKDCKMRIGPFPDWIDAEDFMDDIAGMAKCEPRMKNLKNGCVIELE